MPGFRHFGILPFCLESQLTCGVSILHCGYGCSSHKFAEMRIITLV